MNIYLQYVRYMSEARRYIGNVILTEFIHPRTRKQTRRLYIHLPLQILDDERFLLKNEDQVLVSIQPTGKIEIERV